MRAEADLHDVPAIQRARVQYLRQSGIVEHVSMQPRWGQSISKNDMAQVENIHLLVFYSIREIYKQS